MAEACFPHPIRACGWALVMVLWSSACSAAEPAVDLAQLHFEGIAPPIPGPLPIFTPSSSDAPPIVTPAVEAPAAQRPAPPPRHRSRMVMYLLVGAVVLLVVAGVAYLVGRSSESPTTTEQLR